MGMTTDQPPWTEPLAPWVPVDAWECIDSDRWGATTPGRRWVRTTGGLLRVSGVWAVEVWCSTRELPQAAASLVAALDAAVVAWREVIHAV
jgi:hypothetical protein